jgi:hypothetical protein
LCTFSFSLLISAIATGNWKQVLSFSNDEFKNYINLAPNIGYFVFFSSSVSESSSDGQVINYSNAAFGSKSLWLSVPVAYSTQKLYSGSIAYTVTPNNTTAIANQFNTWKKIG